MTIGIYVRVSTQEQFKNGLSIEDQIRRGIKFCELNKYKYEIYNEGGVSGFLKIQERPQLNKLINKVKNRKNREIDGIYITEMERLVRNTDEGMLIYSILEENGCKLFVLGEEQDLKDNTISLILKVKILLGDFERKNTRDRVIRNLETSVIKGRVGGGGLLNYGYKKGEDKQLIINEEESIIVKEIFEYYLNGLGTKKISSILNDRGVLTKRMEVIKSGKKKNGEMKVRGEIKKEFTWKDSVIYKILTNPIYKGERVFMKKTYNSPIIITPEVFDSVQLLLKKRNSFKDTNNKYFYLLKGLLYCSNCGRRMLGKRRSDMSENYYYCGSKRYREDNCKSRSINIDILDELVWNTTKKLFEDYKILIKKKSKNKSIDDENLEDRIKFLDSLIDDLEKKYQRTLSLFNDDGLTYELTQKYLEEIKSQISSYQEMKIKLTNQYDNIGIEKKFLKTLREYCESIKKVKSEDKKRIILQSIIEKIIVVWNEQVNKHIVRIEYKFNDLNSFLLTRELGVNYIGMGGTLKVKNSEKINIKINYYNINRRDVNFNGSEFNSEVIYED